MDRIAPSAWLFPCLGLMVVVLGMAAAWVTVVVYSGHKASWLALVAALDVALFLRLIRAPRGRMRMLAAVVATTLSIVASQWLIASTQMGLAMGLSPPASAGRIGWVLVHQLTMLNLSRLDWIVLVAALPLAAILVQAPRAPGGQ